MLQVHVIAVQLVLNLFCLLKIIVYHHERRMLKIQKNDNMYVSIIIMYIIIRNISSMYIIISNISSMYIIISNISSMYIISIIIIIMKYYLYLYQQPSHCMKSIKSDN